MSDQRVVDGGEIFDYPIFLHLTDDQGLDITRWPKLAAIGAASRSGRAPR